VRLAGRRNSVLNVLAVFLIFARRDLHKAFEVSYEMTLIRKPRGCRYTCEGQATLDEFFRGRHPYLRLKGMRGHPDLSSEHAIQMKRAEVNESRQIFQRDIAIMMCGDVFTRFSHSAVFFSRRPQLRALLSVARDQSAEQFQYY